MGEAEPGSRWEDRWDKLKGHLVAKGRVAGMDIVEITPKRDVNAITCVTAVRLICNLIGKAVRAGYFD